MLFLVDDEGIPSVAKIVRLQDHYDRTLMASGTLSSGTYFGMEALPRQLALADNAFLGSYILATATNASLEMQGNADATNSDAFYVYAEFGANQAVTYGIDAYDHSIADWVELGTGSTDGLDAQGKPIEVGVELSPTSNPDHFVHPTTKQIKVRLRWSYGSSGYRTYVDRIEVRSK